MITGKLLIWYPFGIRRIAVWAFGSKRSHCHIASSMALRIFHKNSKNDEQTQQQCQVNKDKMKAKDALLGDTIHSTKSTNHVQRTPGVLGCIY
jgi:hypothetical protein